MSNLLKWKMTHQQFLMAEEVVEDFLEEIQEEYGTPDERGYCLSKSVGDNYAEFSTCIEYYAKTKTGFEKVVSSEFYLREMEDTTKQYLQSRLTDILGLKYNKISKALKSDMKKISNR